MTQSVVRAVLSQGIILVLLLSAPMLITGLIVGFTVALLQTITSIQEQTLSFVPRLVAVGLVLLFFLGWILQLGMQFTVRMLWYAAEVVR